MAKEEGDKLLLVIKESITRAQNIRLRMTGYREDVRVTV
jgi:hypothetical protein